MNLIRTSALVVLQEGEQGRVGRNRLEPGHVGRETEVSTLSQLSSRGLRRLPIWWSRFVVIRMWYVVEVASILSSYSDPFY